MPRRAVLPSVFRSGAAGRPAPFPGAESSHPAVVCDGPRGAPRGPPEVDHGERLPVVVLARLEHVWALRIS
eukprot:742655-Pyramimonas_sp.AAC.1